MSDGYSMTMHSAVLAALHDHGGRLVASFELDADGRTIGARSESNRSYRCSGCGRSGHSIERCNGEGQPPKPSYRESRMAERVRKLAAKANYDLETAQQELQRRSEARRKR